MKSNPNPNPLRLRQTPETPDRKSENYPLFIDRTSRYPKIWPALFFFTGHGPVFIWRHLGQVLPLPQEEEEEVFLDICSIKLVLPLVVVVLVVV